jgi:hypothetical protein
MKTIILHNQWALGDTICLSALVRDVQLTYPKQYRLLMSGHYKGVWKHSPYCELLSGTPDAITIKPEYVDGIKEAGRGVKHHFLSWFHKDFQAQTGITVPVTQPKGSIFLSDAEKDNRLFTGRYWIVLSGGKNQMTAKIWSTDRFQQVVDTLAAQGVRCVQAGHGFTRHFHPPLQNCESAVNKTEDIRDLFSLIYHCEGVICGITGPMHIAAVFDKPCVVIAGGREEPWWEAYTNAYYPTAFGPECARVTVEHRFLHTVGLLDCGINNLNKGCWRSRTVAIEPNDHNTREGREGLCKKPVREGLQQIPECLKMIEVDHVVEAVMSYYESGQLPPISSPKRIYSDGNRSVEVTSTIHVPATFEPYHVLPQERAPEDPTYVTMDHPFIGGKFTVCVLCHGDYLDLARRCIESIRNHSPAHRIDLRVALNQPSIRILDYFKTFSSDAITKLYTDLGDRRKYGAMREMFWDAQHPITTPYVLWFDDDSHVVDPTWLIQTADCIAQNHGNGGRLYGTKFIHDLLTYKRKGFNPEKWFKASDWWKNEWMHTAKGAQRAPNGSEIVFASGGFIALATEVIRSVNIPDVRLNHNGGDIVVGAQVNQAGYKVIDFCRGKKPVRWSDHPRRGYQEDFPWSTVK